MRRYVRLVMVWLSFGLAFGAALLVFTARLLLPEGEHDWTHLRDLLAYGGLVWLVFALAAAMATYKYQRSRSHLQIVGWFTQGINTVLLVVILASIGRIFFDLVPGFDALGAVGLLDRPFGAPWDVLADAGSHAGMPSSVAGVMTAPVLSVVALVLIRNGVTWGLNEVRPDRGQASGTGPRPRRQQRRTLAERESKAHAASRKVAVASYTEAKALLASTQMELTFLALDVVGSTDMKKGEDPFVVEQSFADYRKLVERMLRRHAAYK